LKSIIAILFSFWTNSSWFCRVRRSISNISSREQKVRICLCSFAVLHFAIAKEFFWHALHVLSWSYCILKYCLYILIQSRLDNKKTRHLYNIDMWLIYCIIRKKILDSFKRWIWFETSLDSSISNRLFKCDKKLVWYSILWSIEFFSDESTFQRLMIANICSF
jgi:hypothetical protein